MSADGILIMSPRNREVLREAGEHVGTLAEEAKLVYERYVGQRGAKRTAASFYRGENRRRALRSPELAQPKIRWEL